MLFLTFFLFICFNRLHYNRRHSLQVKVIVHLLLFYECLCFQS